MKGKIIPVCLFFSSGHLGNGILLHLYIRGRSPQIMDGVFAIKNTEIVQFSPIWLKVIE